MNTRHKLQLMAIVLAVLLVLPCLALAAPGWLGVSTADVTSDRLSSLKLKEERGVEILNVIADSPAAKAGLKEHDVILEVNGTRVDSVEQLQRMVRELPAGRTVPLLISRDGNTQTVPVKLGERSQYQGRLGDRDFVFRMPEFRMPDIRIPSPNVQAFSLTQGARLGIDVEPLGKQLAEYFGAPGGEGLLVRSVDRDSPAEKAGIKAGDVMVKIDGRKASDAGDIRSLLRDTREKRTFPVQLIRNKKEITVNVTVEPPERSRVRTRIGGERL
jgi:S1-C subfamily serine protease